MPGLMECRRTKYGLIEPLSGARIAGCSYFDAKTAVLIETLIALGAEVQWTNGSIINRSEAKAVAAALKREGISVDLWNDIKDSLQSGWRTAKFPYEKEANVILDDYGLLAKAIGSHTGHRHGNYWPKASQIAVIALNDINSKELKCNGHYCLKIIDANCRMAKAKLASYYGWEGSLVQYIKEVIDKMVAPENVCVIFGFSAEGKSCARSLRSIGVKVMIIDPNSIDALEAKMDSFELVTLQQACKRAKVFVFATDRLESILPSIDKMKNGTLICNIGSSDEDIDWLKNNSHKEESSAVYLSRYKLKNGNHLDRLNLKCLDRVGDRCSNAVSYSYTLWVLAAIHGWSSRGDIYRDPRLLPEQLMEEAAKLHL